MRSDCYTAAIRLLYGCNRIAIRSLYGGSTEVYEQLWLVQVYGERRAAAARPAERMDADDAQIALVVEEVSDLRRGTITNERNVVMFE